MSDGLVDYGVFYTQPALKNGNPKVTTKANLDPDEVVLVGGHADGKKVPLVHFGESGTFDAVLEIRDVRIVQTPRFVDGPKIEGQTTRVFSHHEELRLPAGLRGVCRHTYHLSVVDGRAYWSGLPAAFTASAAENHAAKMARKAAK
jgi:hypothetical protein